MGSEIVVEWAPFELSEEYNEEEFLSASSPLQTDFLETRNGFLKREFFKGEGVDGWTWFIGKIVKPQNLR